MLLRVGPGVCVCGHQPLVWQQGSLYSICERTTSTRTVGADLPKCLAAVLHRALDHAFSEFVPRFYLGTLEARGSSRRFGHLCCGLEIAVFLRMSSMEMLWIRVGSMGSLLPHKLNKNPTDDKGLTTNSSFSMGIYKLDPHRF